jgi:hypothetical protein
VGDDVEFKAILKDPSAVTVTPGGAVKGRTKYLNGDKWPGGLSEYVFPVKPVEGRDIEVVERRIPLIPHY